MIQNLIIESKVIAGNDVDTSVLLDLPVLQTESLALLEEILPGEGAGPVGLGGLLQVTELSNTRKAED